MAKEQNIALTVPMEDRFAVQDAGAVFNSETLSWIVPEGADPRSFVRWMSEADRQRIESRTSAAASSGSADGSADADGKDGGAERITAAEVFDHSALLAEFSDECRSIGLTVPEGGLVADGSRHPVGVDGHRTGGSYTVSMAGVPKLSAINFRTNAKITKYADTSKLDDQTLARMQQVSRETAQREAARIDRQRDGVAWRQREILHECASEMVEELATDYMKRKAIAPTPNSFFLEIPDPVQIAAGIAAAKAAVIPAIALPAQKITGEIRMLQTIYDTSEEKGVKHFPWGAQKAGTMHVMASEGVHALRDAKVAIITEGYATGSSLYKALGDRAKGDKPEAVVVVAFDAANTVNIARAIRAAHPDIGIVLAADDDVKNVPRGLGNIGYDKAREAARDVGGIAVRPQFAAGEQRYEEFTAKFEELAGTPDKAGRRRVRANISQADRAEYETLLAAVSSHNDFNDVELNSTLGLTGVRDQLEPAVGQAIALAEHRTEENRQPETSAPEGKPLQAPQTVDPSGTSTVSTPAPSAARTQTSLQSGAPPAPVQVDHFANSIADAAPQTRWLVEAWDSQTQVFTEVLRTDSAIEARDTIAYSAAGMGRVLEVTTGKEMAEAWGQDVRQAPSFDAAIAAESAAKVAPASQGQPLGTSESDQAHSVQETPVTPPEWVVSSSNSRGAGETILKTKDPVEAYLAFEKALRETNDGSPSIMENKTGAYAAGTFKRPDRDNPEIQMSSEFSAALRQGLKAKGREIGPDGEERNQPGKPGEAQAADHAPGMFDRFKRMLKRGDGPAPKWPDHMDHDAIPEGLRKRYVLVANEKARQLEFHEPGPANKPVFVSAARKLSTDVETVGVVTDMVALAKERGWKSVTIDGTPEFRAMAWLEARKAGLEVTGNPPSQKVSAEFEKWSQANRNKVEESLGERFMRMKPEERLKDPEMKAAEINRSLLLQDLIIKTKGTDLNGIDLNRMVTNDVARLLDGRHEFKIPTIRVANENTIKLPDPPKEGVNQQQAVSQ